MTKNKYIVIKLPDGQDTRIYLRQSADAPARREQTGQGPVILCLHGWLSSSRLWDGIRKPLAGKYTILAPDFPGFGHAAPVSMERVSINHYASIIEHFVSEHLEGHNPYAILAHSMGAIITLEMLKRKRISADRVLLSGCPFVGLPAMLKVFDREGFVARFLMATEKLTGKISAKSLKLLSGFISRNIKPMPYSAITEAMRTDPQTAELLFKELLEPRFKDSELAGLKLKSVIVRGAKDLLATEAGCKKLAGILNAEYREIPESGHTPMIENARGYNKILISLLNS